MSGAWIPLISGHFQFFAPLNFVTTNRIFCALHRDRYGYRIVPQRVAQLLKMGTRANSWTKMNSWHFWNLTAEIQNALYVIKEPKMPLCIGTYEHVLSPPRNMETVKRHVGGKLAVRSKNRPHDLGAHKIWNFRVFSPPFLCFRHFEMSFRLCYCAKTRACNISWIRRRLACIHYFNIRRNGVRFLWRK